MSTKWHNPMQIETQRWRCGYCGADVASDRGWVASQFGASSGGQAIAYAPICPSCDIPSLVHVATQVTRPAPIFGEAVESLPEDVKALYQEARAAVGSGAPNSAAIACRKILMHVAVEHGAPTHATFAAYVDHLEETHLIPPGARDWVDEIREHGNAANHEIELMTQEEAETVVEFTGMLLRVVYEFPERGRAARAARRERRQ